MPSQYIYLRKVLLHQLLSCIDQESNASIEHTEHTDDIRCVDPLFHKELSQEKSYIATVSTQDSRAVINDALGYAKAPVQ